MSSPRRPLAIVLAAGVAGWLAISAIEWLFATVLGHDEAQYAIAARDLLAGEPIRWDYLSVGMNALALPGVLAGGSELALRAAPVLASLGFLLAAAWLARRAFGDATAVWTVAVLAATQSVVRRAPELLSDMPSAACLLAGTAILLIELLREPGPRWRLVIAAPCFAAAFYLRYGSVLAFAAIGLPALVVGWRAVLRRPWIALATIALLGLLLLPHFLWATDRTGSPLGIFFVTSDVLGDAYLGKSLVVYTTSNPFLFYGVVTAPVMLAGLLAIRRARDRRVLLMWLIAVGDIVIVGLTPVPQSRYIILGIVLLVILGVEQIRLWIDERSRETRRVLGILCAIAITASWISAGAAMYVLHENRVERAEPTLAAVAAIREDARGAPCHVIGRRTTQLQWYTGCVAVYVADAATVARERVYLVYQPGQPYQPDPAGQPGVPRKLLERPDLTVMRYDPVGP